jgi:RNA polymerase sigma factor (sigma-70 family)
MAIEGGLAAARERATIEMVRRHEAALRRTARRYSLCAEDAEDAYQRALEIALTKAPTDRAHELIRWTQTVTKHEALAIRRHRERLLGNRPARADDEGAEDWLSLVPSPGFGPGERVERGEAIARSREALRTLKPAELRALTLLAEGYSYAEISSITGFSATKVNRCLAEGRERYRRFLARSEAGELCREVAPLLSSYCDGELSRDEHGAVREHLRACAPCRAAARAYKAAPEAAEAIAPALLASRTLMGRLQEAAGWVQSRLPGGGAAEPVASAAGGAPGAGLVAAAKMVAACAAAGGTAAACVAVGVTPGALGLGPAPERPSRIERVAKERAPARARPAPAAARGEATPRGRAPRPRHDRRQPAGEGASAATSPEYAEPVAPTAPAPVEAEPVEYAAPPPPEPAPAPPPATEGGGVAGEFGP